MSSIQLFRKTVLIEVKTEQEILDTNAYGLLYLITFITGVIILLIAILLITEHSS